MIPPTTMEIPCTNTTLLWTCLPPTWRSPAQTRHCYGHVSHHRGYPLHKHDTVMDMSPTTIEIPCTDTTLLWTCLPPPLRSLAQTRHCYGHVSHHHRGDPLHRHDTVTSMDMSPTTMEIPCTDTTLLWTCLPPPLRSPAQTRHCYGHVSHQHGDPLHRHGTIMYMSSVALI